MSFLEVLSTDRQFYHQTLQRIFKFFLAFCLNY